MFRALLNPEADTCSHRHSDTVELVEEQIKGVRIWTVAEGNSYLQTRLVLERQIGANCGTL